MLILYRIFWRSRNSTPDKKSPSPWVEQLKAAMVKSIDDTDQRAEISEATSGQNFEEYKKEVSYQVYEIKNEISEIRREMKNQTNIQNSRLERQEQFFNSTLEDALFEIRSLVHESLSEASTNSAVKRSFIPKKR